MANRRSTTIDPSQAARLSWLKSRFCTMGNCVEAAPLEDGGIAIRNSTTPGVAPIVFDSAEFADFIAGVKAGDFDHLVA